MCCLCIQFTHENTSERTILHQVNKKNSGGGGKPHQTPPPFQVWLLALQKRLATPLLVIYNICIMNLSCFCYTRMLSASWEMSSTTVM